MTTKSPLISICVPNLNKRAFLAERMETLLAQTFTDWEMIVCDSFSDDRSWEFFQKFTGDPRIRLYQVPREGIYAGWNECLRRARGEYINVATSDDTADPCLLERLVAPLERDREKHLASCDFIEIDKQSRQLPMTKHNVRLFLGDRLKTPHVRSGKTDFLLQAVYGTVWVTMAAVLFRRSLLDKVGLFPIDVGSYGDVIWSMRACLFSDVLFVPEPLTTLRIYEGQATPGSMTAANYHRIYKCINSVVNDSSLPFPDEWRGKENWREKITWPFHRRYLRALDLYRWILRSDAKRFREGVAAAMKIDPGFLVSQTLRGFSVRRELEEPDPVEEGKKMLTEFNAPWPPLKLEQP